MPGFLLHMGALVQCMHGGMAQPTSPNPRVKVMGQAIAMKLDTYSVAGCTFAPPAGNGPCATAKWVTSALRVKSNGVPVLLSDAKAVCAPTGTGVLISTTQMRAKGQ